MSVELELAGVIPRAHARSELLAQVQHQRAVVDSRLSAPKRWRGPLRREIGREIVSPERARLVGAFDRVLELGRQRRQLTPEILNELHAEATGVGRYRTRGVRIGRFREFPSAAEVPGLVTKLLDGIATSSDPTPLLAVRVHVELLLIHPFADGNGRTARLASSLLLVRGGYRSTLFTAVEQHWLGRPRGYVEALEALRDGTSSREECESRFLSAMASSSAHVTWFREREARLRQVCERLGLEGEQQDRALIGFDLADERGGLLADAVAGSETPWVELAPLCSATERRLLAHQLTRLRAEEADEAISSERRRG